ncbi:MAG: hypothetical protein RL065_1466 [Bacteroidota bacterium]
MKKAINYLLIAIIFILNFSCSHSKDGEKPIARVMDKYLYPADLAGIIKPGTTAKDSISIVKNYISDWIRQQVLVAKAEENIEIEKKELEKKIEDYKESILIYQYENELVKQKLDTIVTEKQIEDFYTQHKEDFILRNDLVRLTYIKIQNTEPSLINIKRMFVDPSINILQMQDACKKAGLSSSFDESVWTSTDFFPPSMQSSFPKTKGFLEQKDSVFTYLSQVKEFMSKGNPSPKSYVKDQIFKIIVNQRKVEMIKNIREDLYKEALQKGDFEIINEN